MGISIYYEARRSAPLSAGEQSAIKIVERHYPLEALMARSGTTADEFDGEDFCIYTSNEFTDADVIFKGATKLPLCSEAAFWCAVQYWCALLSEVRSVLTDAAWTVGVDDDEIAWDETTQAFDPSKRS